MGDICVCLIAIYEDLGIEGDDAQISIYNAEVTCPSDSPRNGLPDANSTHWSSKYALAWDDWRRGSCCRRRLR